MATIRTVRGGIAGFIIIGIILAVLVIGVTQFVHIRGDQARKDQAIVAVEASEKTTAETSVASQESTSSDTATTTDTTQQGTAQNNGSEPIISTPPATAELPTTGPESTLFMLVGLAALTAVGTAYFASRTQLRRTL